MLPSGAVGSLILEIYSFEILREGFDEMILMVLLYLAYAARHSRNTSMKISIRHEKLRSGFKEEETKNLFSIILFYYLLFSRHNPLNFHSDPPAISTN